MGGGSSKNKKKKEEEKKQQEDEARQQKEEQAAAQRQGALAQEHERQQRRQAEETRKAEEQKRIQEQQERAAQAKANRENEPKEFNKPVSFAELNRGAAGGDDYAAMKERIKEKKRAERRGGRGRRPSVSTAATRPSVEERQYVRRKSVIEAHPEFFSTKEPLAPSPLVSPRGASKQPSFAGDLPETVPEEEAPAADDTPQMSVRDQMLADMAKQNEEMQKLLAAKLDAGKNYIQFLVTVDFMKDGTNVTEHCTHWITSTDIFDKKVVPQAGKKIVHDSLSIYLVPNDDPEQVEVRDDGNHPKTGLEVDPGAYTHVKFSVSLVDVGGKDQMEIGSFIRSRDQLIEMTKGADVDEWGTGCRIDVPAADDEGDRIFEDDDDGDGFVSCFFYPDFKKTGGVVVDVLQDVEYTVNYQDIGHMVDVHEDVEGWGRLILRE
eukprot:TRINITY_DN6135_c0_g1_i1.p1 TRINITY_DN6135_c0_g1~~TRINITY_DN6135_c0_g1_i1.p1  ORF type:complete len:435 (+),score=119.29 TRINITY_DN6135_c0_g1_i1:2177-3481(+)